jgi:hypothetical protein
LRFRVPGSGVSGFGVCLHGDGDGDARARAHRIFGGEFTNVYLVRDGRVHGASSHVGDRGACDKVWGLRFGVRGFRVWGQLLENCTPRRLGATSLR